MSEQSSRTDMSIDTDGVHPKTLRQRAEAMARTSRTDIKGMKPEDIQALVHELQVHQIELQIQNEELMQTQVELANARDRYADLYEFAPVGYVTLDNDSRVLEANFAAATLLGVDRKDLTGSRLTQFIAANAQDDFYMHRQAVADTDQKQIWELAMHKGDKSPLVVRLESVRERAATREVFCRTAMIDITARRHAEDDLREIKKQLELRVHDRTVELMQTVGDLREEVVHRQGIEELLRHEVEVTTGLVETTQAIVLLLDGEGKISYFNEYMAKLTGYTLDEAKGKDWFDTFLPKKDRHDVRDIFKQAISGTPTLGNINPIVTKDGQLRQIQWYDANLTNADGKFTGLLCTGHDITERLRTEEQMLLLGEAVAHLGEGVVITSDGLDWPEPCIIFVNDALCRITGYRREELVGQSPRIFQGEETNREALNYLKAELAENRSVGVELKNYRKDGTCYDCELFVTPLLNGEGKRTHFVSVHRDISERKQAERMVYEREQRLSSVLNTAVDAIVTINQSGIITGINSATEQMFGYNERELIGQNVKMLMPSPYRDEHDQYLAKFLETGEAKIIGVGRELVGRHKDGSIIPIDLAVSQVDHLGEFTGIIRDISERKALERHLAEVRADEQRHIAQELHDGVGGQMTGVGMLAATLAKQLEMEKSKYAESARELLQHMRTAHDQLRDVSQGLMPVQNTPRGLTVALAELANRYNKDSLKCVYEYAGDVVFDDLIKANNLYRIAQEAVSNAVRHGQATQIVIRLEASDSRVRLSIEDNGTGFQENPDGKGGMGLRTMKHRAGLIDAKFRVESPKHGGTIVVCSFLNPMLNS